MANVVYPQTKVDLHGSINSSAFSSGFGFGLSSPSMIGWSPSSGHGALTHHVAFQQLASSISQSSSRPQKRRLEQDDEQDNGTCRLNPGTRDDAMDRSPTPERPKRAVPKRARTTPATASSNTKDGVTPRDTKEQQSDQDIDVGVLLGWSFSL